MVAAGLVAEKYFGFDGSVSQAEVDVERDHANARALGNSLLVCLIVPWALCLFSYTGEPGCQQNLSQHVSHFSEKPCEGQQSCK